MRLARLALATLFSAALALPALAQTAPATKPAPTTTAAPAAKPAAPASTSALKNGHYEKCTDGAVVADADKISINTGSPADLDKLYGIGQARAKKITDGRPYKSTDELTTKAGIGKAEFADIKCHIKL